MDYTILRDAIREISMKAYVFKFIYMYIYVLSDLILIIDPLLVEIV